MKKKTGGIRRGSFGRGMAMSLAGIRAGGAFALDGALQKLRPGETGADSAFVQREAKRFVAELGKLKGSYVKIGQMLAQLGEHFLPPALTAALHDLEAATEPLPWSELEPALRTSLGPRLDELVVEPRALAAASLSQVHRATIRASGEVICLKIQYPGLGEVIDSDFDAVVRMLLLARWIKAGRELDAWLEDMRIQLHHEIDYRREARMGDTVAALLARQSATDRRYCVPRRFERYCSDQVLALEYIDGLQVTRPEVAALSQRRRNALGRNMLELFFLELYDWGVLQTDPNFGNYLIRIGPRSDQLVLLDFGSTLSCDESFLRYLGNAIAAGQVQDRDALIDSLTGLGCLSDASSDSARQSFSEFCLQLLEPLRPPERLPAQFLNASGEYCWGRSQLLRRAGKLAARATASRDFASPSRDFALIARKLTGVFTFIAVLDAQFNAHDLVQEHIARWRKRG